MAKCVDLLVELNASLERSKSVYISVHVMLETLGRQVLSLLLRTRAPDLKTRKLVSLG
jgi:hypothetical protein